MPHWTCDKCGARLYSASESLKWQDCPVCTGKLAQEREDRPQPAPPPATTLSSLQRR